ncbi:MAG: hypothetical protein K6A44_04015 [bacterium]|nr:hypothetical protein [bacterium]
MLDKLFSFLGFNSGKSIVGLRQLTEELPETDNKKASNKSSENIKLTDLLRRA